MAFSRILFTVLLLCVSCYATTIKVPAFIWGDLAEHSTKANPLETITSEEFEDILKPQIAKDQVTIIFADETLSVEDISSKIGKGQTFPFLQKFTAHSIYLPSVNNPLGVLNELADENVDRVTLTGNGLTAEIENGKAKFLFINLKDAREGETRKELLKRHNDFMEDMFMKLKANNKNVVAIYTAHFPSWVISPSESHLRVRRQAAENVTEEGNNHHLDGLHIYYKNILIIDGNNTISLNGNLNSQTVINETEQNVTMTFGEYSFVMNFILKSGYWFLDSVNFGGEHLLPNLEVYALQHWSYRCAQDVMFTSANVSRGLKFEDVQIQPYFMETNQSMPFGETFDCVGYFSAPIWAALMVTFLLLAITFYGIMMMMDIRTMDRFDDPKGKTITINAGE